MKFWQKILLRLLYLTPFGYLLSTISLIQGERTPEVFISLEEYSPIRAKIKKKPSGYERINWFINGIVLLTEGGFVLANNVANSLGGGFSLLAFLFGLVCLISAIFPRVPWNRPIFRT